MSIPMSAKQVLDREHLEMRAKLLELAACFDRLDRAAGDVRGDGRMGAIREALEVLGEETSLRAERIQKIFSRPYADDWRETFRLSTKQASS